MICLLILTIGFIYYPFTKPFCAENIRKSRIGFQDAFTGISVDSEDNFYLGFDTGIYCYNPSGDYLFCLITPKTTGSYEFKIEDDILTVWIIRSDKKYLYNLLGNLLAEEKYEPEELPKYTTSFDQRKVWKNDELIYRYHSILGFWWVTDVGGNCLAHIPVFMFAMKVCKLVVFILVCMLLHRKAKKYMTDKKRHKYNE